MFSAAALPGLTHSDPSPKDRVQAMKTRALHQIFSNGVRWLFSYGEGKLRIVKNITSAFLFPFKEESHFQGDISYNFICSLCTLI